MWVDARIDMEVLVALFRETEDLWQFKPVPTVFRDIEHDHDHDSTALAQIREVRHVFHEQLIVHARSDIGEKFITDRVHGDSNGYDVQFFQEYSRPWCDRYTIGIDVDRALGLGFFDDVKNLDVIMHQEGFAAIKLHVIGMRNNLPHVFEEGMAITRRRVGKLVRSLQMREEV